MDEQNFEWGPETAAAHALNMALAFSRREASLPAPRELRSDVTKPEYGERRMMAVGRVGLLMISVIYTERPGERRIISARRARRIERKQYRQGAESP